MLHTAQDLSYTTLASVNPEASDWRQTGKGAHRLLFARFFVCVAVFLHGRIAQGVFGLADFLYVGTPTCTVCPPQLALEQAGF